MSEKSRGLEGLTVWQKSIGIVEMIQEEVLPMLPPEEKWALSSQLRRSSQSISANIAEGYGRYYFQEGVRFCYIAWGSLEETYSHLYLARSLGHIGEELFLKFDEQINEIRRLLAGYIKFLKQSKQGEHEPGAGIYETSANYMIELIDKQYVTMDQADQSPGDQLPE